MNIVLPRASRGVVFRRLIEVEFNDFEVERVLPGLFYLVVTRGRTRAHRPNDPKALAKYLDALALHPRLDGFNDPDGVRLLDRWLRAAVVRVSAVGRSRKAEQLDYFVPTTLLVYKTGLPDQRQRNVHTFLYGTMVRSAEGGRGTTEAQEDVRRVFVRALGTGVNLDPGPAYDGRYDEDTVIDIQTLLSLRFLDGFLPTRVSQKQNDDITSPALPALASLLGEDILAYMRAYVGLIPAASLVRGLLALASFEMFVYSAKLYYATNSLIADGAIPPAMLPELTASPPEIYCDFTREPGGPSDEIARAAVDRDLEELSHFYDSLMRLRTIDRFVGMVPEARPRLEPLSDRTPEYLALLWSMRSDPMVRARSHSEIESIKSETIAAAKTENVEAEFEALVDELLRGQENDHFAVASTLLADAQRKNAMTNLVRWFWSAGGLRSPWGLLTGNVTGRRRWRYQMSDDLLSVLVQVALIDRRGGTDQVSIQPRMRLSEFLEFLETRFGVIVGRPPVFLDNPNTRRAARSNLEALKRRLRQMGYFVQLSDDFNAQYLTTPFVRSS